MWEWLIGHPLELLVFSACCFLFGTVCSKIINYKVRKEAAKDEIEEADEGRKKPEGK